MKPWRDPYLDRKAPNGKWWFRHFKAKDVFCLRWPMKGVEPTWRSEEKRHGREGWKMVSDRDALYLGLIDLVFEAKGGHEG